MSKKLNIENRLLTLKRVICFVFIVISLRIFIVQIWKHKIYKNISENNIYLNIKKSALRANICDRNGKVLAKSEPIFTLSYSMPKTELEYIKNIFKKNNKDILIKNNSIIIENLTWEELKQIFSINELPVPEIEIDQMRAYPLNNMSAHIVGYLKRNLYYQYKGAYGVEKIYDNLLNGFDGKDVFLINAKRNRLKKHISIEAKMKNTLYLTIDNDLQQEAYNALAEHKQGAIMIVNPQNGAILVATSFPSFNPEDFTQKNNTTKKTEKQKILQQYYADEGRPLFNKFLNGAYFPGSTIKPFMILAMLKKQIPHEYFCNGVFHLGKNSFRCLGNHGHIHLKDALQVSCNYALYSASQYLTQQDLIEIWQEFGLGEPVLKPFETNTPKFPHKKQWKKLDSLFMQIGQVSTLVTLAQLVRAYSRLASGKKIQLTLLKQEEAKNQEAANLNIDKKHLEIVKTALFETINKPGGTAFGKYKFIDAAGKTGTAQLSKIKSHEYKKSNLMREWKFRDNSIFCAYAPSQNPKVCGCVIIIHGGSGASSAPILLKLLDKALQKELQKEASKDLQKEVIIKTEGQKELDINAQQPAPRY